MSISRFQERFLSGGCAKLLLGVMAAVFVGGLLYMGSGQTGGDSDANSSNLVAAKVGTVEVPANAIDTAVQTQLQQLEQQSQGQEIPPLQLASIESGVVTNVIEGATALYLARQSGADFSDESVLSVIGDMLDQQLQMQQMQYDMTPAQPGQKKDTFEEFVKKQTGKTLKEFKQQNLDEIRETLKDPAKKDLLMADAARGLLVRAYKGKTAPTDEELKNHYSTFDVKRVLFKDAGEKKAVDLAAPVLADIKAGKLTFEQAVDRFSKDQPQPKKKLSETTLPLQGSLIANVDDYKALRGLKVGDVSEVVTTPEGASIYKVVKITPNLPKDFDKEKAKYRDQVAEQRAQALVQQDMDKAKKSDLVQWSVPGYQVLYDLGQVYSDPSMTDETQRLAAMKKVYEKAKAAAQKEGPGQRQANLAAYIAFDTIYNNPKSDKTKLRDERIEVLTAVLEETESPLIRMELLDLFVEKKDAAAASEQLLLVAQSNNDYGVEGQSMYSQVSSKLTKLKSSGLLAADQEAEVQKELTRWRQEKADFEKQKAEDEAEQKRQEEEMQKEVEKQMKEEAASKKNAPKTDPAKK